MKIFLPPPYKKGFTLAEVLITLVVIGIIAAITIPTMMNSKNNEELRAGLLKAQSTLAGALEKYYIQNGERIKPEELLGASNVKPFKNKIIPYIAIAKECDDGNAVTGNLSKACVPNNAQIYKTYNNKNWIDHYYIDDGQFVMNNGMTVLIENNNSLFISVDVNGFKKKPNKAGHDLFSFEINSSGNLVPMGAKGTKFYSATDAYCSNTSTVNTNGFGCTAKALADPNYFKNLH